MIHLLGAAQQRICLSQSQEDDWIPIDQASAIDELIELGANFCNDCMREYSKILDEMCGHGTVPEME